MPFPALPKLIIATVCVFLYVFSNICSVSDEFLLCEFELGFPLTLKREEYGIRYNHLCNMLSVFQCYSNSRP